MFVDPGALRSELALEVSKPEPDGLGGHSESWVEVATVFGRIEPVNGGQRCSAPTRRWRA